jgi:dipeptide/tripeptide permease
VAIDIGSMIAIVVFPYIQNGPEYDYFVPYLVAAATLFVSAVLFLIGWRFYIHVKSAETVITKCIPVVINAFQSWYRYRKNKRSKRKESINSAQMQPLNVVHTLTEEEALLGIYGRPSTFLDFARVANGGKFQNRIVNEVNSLRGPLVVFTLLVPFWLIYNQVK